MRYSDLASDFSEPATLQQEAAEFSGSAFTLVSQPHLLLAAHATVRENTRLTAIAVSYSFVANPTNLNNPENFVVDIDEVEGFIRDAEESNKPAWFQESLKQDRYPMLWNAVMSEYDPAKTESLAHRLIAHMENIIINTDETRIVAEPGRLPSLRSGVREDDIRDCSIAVGNETLMGITLTDNDWLGWAFIRDSTYVTVGLPRQYADQLKVALEVVN